MYVEFLRLTCGFLYYLYCSGLCPSSDERHGDHHDPNGDDCEASCYNCCTSGYYRQASGYDHQASGYYCRASSYYRQASSYDLDTGGHDLSACSHHHRCPSHNHARQDCVQEEDAQLSWSARRALASTLASLCSACMKERIAD